MTCKNQTLLGRISRIHGYDGTVLIRLEKSFVENIPEMESVFLEIEGRPVPFFISVAEYQGGDLLRMKFDGYQSIEKVSEFNGCSVFLTSYAKIKHPAQKIVDFEEFTVLLPDDEILGKVREIIQNPGQYLLRVLTPDNREILIPFHEDLVVKTNRRTRTIVMNLPEGLTEIN